jgi:1-phosphofructokinase
MMSKPDCGRILTVTLNPAIDRTVLLSSFNYGQVNRADEVVDDIGGKGINVARMLQSLGSRVIAGGLIGEANRPSVEFLLNHEKFQTNFITVPGITRTNTKLVNLSDSSTTDINTPGFNLSTIREQITDKLLQKTSAWAQEYAIIVFAGSIPPGLDTNIYGRMIRRCHEINPDCFTVVDAEGQPLLEAIKYGVNMIKPNTYELASIADISPDELANRHDRIELLQQFLTGYNLRKILLSDGSNGATLAVLQDNKMDVYEASALPVELVSTVGAGDSLLAGYLSSYCGGDDDKRSLAIATACAAAAVSRNSRHSFDRKKTEAAANMVDISHSSKVL